MFTHFLPPDILSTSLLWSVTASGTVYAVLAGVCFFTVMEEAINEVYRAETRSRSQTTKLRTVHKLLPVRS